MLERWSSLFEIDEARPVKIGAQRVTVISKALRLQLLGGVASWVWNRPAAVRVQTEGAGEVILPVADYTRQLQVLMLVLGLVGSILLAALLQKRRL